MTSKTTDVAEYLQEAPAERRAALEKLRELCRRNLKGYQECMEYGMPVYKRNGSVEIAFASQKQYIALYVLKKEVLDEFRGALGATSIGKGCIRFRRPEQIDFSVVAQLLARAGESASRPC